MARPDQQIETVAIPKRIEIATTFQSRDNTFAKSARIINGYAEFDREIKSYSIFKRPGLSTIQFATTGVAGRGVAYFETFPGVGKLISIVDRNVYSHNLVTLAATLIGTTVAGPSGINSFVIIPTVGGTPAKLVFGDGTTAYWTDGATITQLLNANNFPTGTNSFFRGWGYLDAYLYLFRPTREILGTTNLDDPVFWNLLSSIQARVEPDYGVSISKHLNYILALKQWTVDFFYDAGNPSGSPLSALQGASLPYGLLHAGTLQDIDGAQFWVCTNRSSGPQVIMLYKMQPTIISTPDVERLLRLASSDSWFSQVFSLGGHRFYVISAQNTAFTLVYDLEEKLWYQWTDAAGSRWTPTYATYLPSTNPTIPWTYVAQDLAGNLYFLGEAYTYTNDAGTVVPVDIYTPVYDAGTKRGKNLGAMLFDCDKVGGRLKVRYNDYDYDVDKWSNFRDVDLFVDVPKLTDCGSFTARAWNFRYEGNTSLRLKTVDLQIDVGSV